MLSARQRQDIQAFLDAGNRKPIIPILAGLPNLPERLWESISGGHFTPGHQRHLKILSRDESVEYVLRLMDHFEVTGEGPQ